jgi:hypothetical protein
MIQDPGRFQSPSCHIGHSGSYETEKLGAINQAGAILLEIIMHARMLEQGSNPIIEQHWLERLLPGLITR